MNRPQRAIDAYDEGNLNRTDLLIELGRCRVEEDFAGFFSSLSKELRDEWTGYVATLPNTAEGWARHRLCWAGGWLGATRQRVEEEWSEAVRMLRRAAERIRAASSCPPCAAPTPPAAPPAVAAPGHRER